MKKLNQVLVERDELKARLTNLVNLLKEATASVDVAIGVELEYADYDSAERLKVLKKKIELEVKNCE
jgi:5,10-methylenetetrahydrofolate reductase